jgi:hypothetical protein
VKSVNVLLTKQLPFFLWFRVVRTRNFNTSAARRFAQSSYIRSFRGNLFGIILTTKRFSVHPVHITSRDRCRNRHEVFNNTANRNPREACSRSGCQGTFAFYVIPRGTAKNSPINFCQNNFRIILPSMTRSSRLSIPFVPIFYVRYSYIWGTRWRSWLSHCATSRKAAGSIPDGVTGVFQWQSFRSHCGLGVDSASNINEYQESFLLVKTAGA